MKEKISLTKGKSIFMVDLILIPVFALVIYSGLELHVAGDAGNHDMWEYWAHYHIIVAILSLVFGWLHVKAHWGWYKSLIKNGAGKKSRITVIFSVLFLTETITGIILVCFIEGGNYPVGLWHLIFGLAMTVCILIHLTARFPVMIKGLRRKKKASPPLMQSPSHR